VELLLQFQLILLMELGLFNGLTLEDGIMPAIIMLASIMSSLEDPLEVKLLLTSLEVMSLTPIRISASFTVLTHFTYALLSHA